MSLPHYPVAAIASLLGAMIVPSGRCDRKGLLLCALLLLVLQVAAFAVIFALDIPHFSITALTLDAIFLWLGSCAIAKRLHDLGLSAWRMLWAALGVIVWATVVALAITWVMGADALAPDGVGLGLAALGSSLPVLAMTLWAHLARGTPGPNRFGPATDATGFSPPLPHWQTAACNCPHAQAQASVPEAPAVTGIPAPGTHY